MSRILKLETPFMRGPDVKALQQAMHANKYGDYFRFAVDGVYGPLTAHRVAATKWHLGYTVEMIEPVAGDLILNILTGKTPLSPEMAARRKRREEEKPAPHPGNTLGEKALRWALDTVGQHENPPGSNRCAATDEWGHGPMPWCNVEVSLAYIHAGSIAFSKAAQRFQYVPAMLAAAKAGGAGLKVIAFNDLQAGDIIVHGPGAYHTTLHDRFADKSRRLEWDVGGNEGNVGTVFHDIHDASYADGFIRVTT